MSQHPRIAAEPKKEEEARQLLESLATRELGTTNVAVLFDKSGEHPDRAFVLSFGKEQVYSDKAYAENIAHRDGLSETLRSAGLKVNDSTKFADMGNGPLTTVQAVQVDNSAAEIVRSLRKDRTLKSGRAAG